MQFDVNDVVINEAVFQLVFDEFVEYVEVESGCVFKSFSSNPRTKIEDYKLVLHREATEQLNADNWKQDHIGLGKISSDAVHAIESELNNIFEWDMRRGEEKRVHQPIFQALKTDTSTSIESVLFDLYRKDDAENSFHELVSIFGHRSGLISYLFFLKDRSTFMPLAPTFFDNAFNALQIDLKTLSKFTWDVYCEFNSVLKAIQRQLQLRMDSEVTLLDAHSFLWILGYNLYGQGKSPQIDETTISKATEKLAIYKTRIGQNIFRKKLIDYWGSCALTGCTEKRVLRASHIKPWSMSTSEERLDINNGLLLAAGIDACFDKGLISFDDSGNLLISQSVSDADRVALGLDLSMKLNRDCLVHSVYLEYHRVNIFSS